MPHRIVTSDAPRAAKASAAGARCRWTAITVVPRAARTPPRGPPPRRNAMSGRPPPRTWARPNVSRRRRLVQRHHDRIVERTGDEARQPRNAVAAGKVGRQYDHRRTGTRVLCQVRVETSHRGSDRVPSVLLAGKDGGALAHPDTAIGIVHQRADRGRDRRGRSVRPTIRTRAPRFPARAWFGSLSPAPRPPAIRQPRARSSRSPNTGPSRPHPSAAPIYRRR